jgi:acyl-CoA synthetase (AMP-forming)/AMP-acid ligase II
MNIVEPILFQCRRQPPAPAICVPGSGIELISYRRLEQFIHNLARRFHALNLAPRSLVGIHVSDGIFHIVTTLALIRIGMTPMSLRDAAGPLPVKLDLLVTDQGTPDAIAERLVLVDLSWTEGDGRPMESHLLPVSHEDDLCRIILTSGTSNVPKAVALSHKLLTARIGRHVTFGNRLGNCDRVYCDIPISSSLGFQFVVSTLSRGGMIVLSGNNATSTLRAIEEYRVQCLVGSPGGLETLLRWFETFPAYQSNIEVIFCGGDVLSRTLSERLRSQICSHVIVAYGSTEASMTAIAYAHEVALTPRAVGYVTPGVTLEIVDAAGAALPAGHDGVVRIRTEFGVTSYYGTSDGDAAFKDGWFYPGDLGSLNADGLLFISGREQLLLNLAGNKINPEVIEQALKEFDGVKDAAATAIPNEFGNNEVHAIITVTAPISEQAIRAYCEARIPPPFTPIQYHLTDKIPLNEMGKIERRQLPLLVKQLSSGTS